MGILGGSRGARVAEWSIYWRIWAATSGSDFLLEGKSAAINRTLAFACDKETRDHSLKATSLARFRWETARASADIRIV
jgi:hypothetical protein